MRLNTQTAQTVQENLTPTIETLDALIPQYASNKAELEDYKKICDKENAQIKAIMTDLALQHYEAGGYKVTCSVQDKSTMNEGSMLALAHEFDVLSGCIKTKEYFDFDVLEKLIYDGEVPKSILERIAEAKEEKFVTVLRLTKVKEKK